MVTERCEALDLVTLAGLVFETAAGLRRAIVPPLERDYDFPPQSLEVLIRLSRSPGGRLRMSDLAAQTALTPSGLTRAVDRLCDAGLVARQVCPEDRRGSFAALTEDGTTRMCEALACHHRQIQSVLGGVLDDGQFADLEALLRRIRDHLNPQAARVSPD
ncbi:MAG: MarR family winged helix-turn-helix transcriptional regulator [Acidimicrobiales bacterium]